MELSLHKDKSFTTFLVVQDFLTSTIYHKMPACLPQLATGVLVTATVAHTQQLLARGVADLSIVLDCFLHLNHKKILAATFNTIYEIVVTCLSIKGLYE